MRSRWEEIRNLTQTRWWEKPGGNGPGPAESDMQHKALIRRKHARRARLGARAGARSCSCSTKFQSPAARQPGQRGSGRSLMKSERGPRRGREKARIGGGPPGMVTEKHKIQKDSALFGCGPSETRA